MVCAGYSEGGHDSCQVLYDINSLLTKKFISTKIYIYIYILWKKDVSE
jgi:hypothetical protein